MKKLFFLFIIALSALFITPVLASSPILEFSTAAEIKAANKKSSYKQYKELLEFSLGRKLKFNEKIALRIQTLAPNFTPEESHRANNQALLGFIFSICGLLILWPLLIPGLIISNNALKSERNNSGILTDSNLSLAKAGKIISIVGLAIIALAVIIIAIVIAGSGFAGL